jgi:predicted ester cyclase
MGIPPTDKAIEVGGIAILRVVGDKVTELRGQFDQMGLMRQLGVVP